MDKKDEALKLALEALEQHGCPWIRHEKPYNEAITAIREALAEQPAQQEPVATVQDLDEVKRKHLVYELGFDWKDPLYTSPPASKPLTDEEIKRIYEDCDAPTGGQFTIAFARAIEAAHGIKGDA